MLIVYFCGWEIECDCGDVFCDVFCVVGELLYNGYLLWFNCCGGGFCGICVVWVCGFVIYWMKKECCWF